MTADRGDGAAEGNMTVWKTRSDLASAGRTATGLLLVSADADSVAAAGGDAERTGAYAAALEAAGVGAVDRVVVALSGDGELAGAQWARAAAGVARAAASVGPRGRLRLHHALESLGATTLVITPTGAMDLLARLHLEFLLDPLDLGLRHIILTGEIASRRTMPHLAAEFEAEVTEVYCSPFTAVPLGWRSSEPAPLTLFDPGSVGLASLEKDESLVPPYAPGLAEVVVADPATGATLRTGQVVRVAAGDAVPAPEHTVGDHVLVRGVWLSLNRIERALGKIDGVSGWELGVSRQGTLDAVTLTVTFNRESLVGNPMWKSRIRQSLRALTPITIDVEISPQASEAAPRGVVNDARGHHLGRDRTAIAR
ncbi:hypothetical protein [Streptosporangium roseum]|uniref:Coenzyme F390 synthetase-like protein n=1 Tax=Streptosporangium roseum (strain ATCC 12428 / DSM 43021 / JCM 3005 / KCTC 9067 / NCIMB 10171 / NRRL 2505 / NI 9100) TaxID=479432 RepID=D2AXR6_STRRD|nr:hypothetical protein [Streptosporangium roseum]ACZ85087.1 conserved hypothetical protein [Streptosporangium roseum DSM 43021]